MSVLEVLSQAHLLDLRIRIRLEQLDSLNSLAVKATTTYGNEPVSGTRDIHKREDIICKIVDLQNEINAEIDRLVDMKREIKIMIEAVPFVDGRTILEQSVAKSIIQHFKGVIRTSLDSQAQCLVKLIFGLVGTRRFSLRQFHPCLICSS